jgi:hypothetical protein
VSIAVRQAMFGKRSGPAGVVRRVFSPHTIVVAGVSLV